jgi:hypothetical protein
MKVGRAGHADVATLQLLLHSLDSAALAMGQQESRLTQLPTAAHTPAPSTHVLTARPIVVMNSTHNSTRSIADIRSGESSSNLRGRRLAKVPSGQPSGSPSEVPTLTPSPPAIQLILPSLSIFTQAATAVQVPGMLMQNMRYDTFGVSVFVTPINQHGK